MKKSLLLLGFISLSFGGALMAQPPGPGGDLEPDPGCFPPPCVPIDGGLSWLLIAGVAYGGKKVFDLNKEVEEEKID